MCNMAAFAGSVPAAPVLLEMLERQEGLWSGHFSGISTIFEGKVYTARVCGNVARLRRETDAEKLPGTVGIAHSRTPGNIPLATWSHPFPVGDTLAYCANGAPGCFAGVPDFSKLLKELDDAGVRFLSESDVPAKQSRPSLPDGRSLHVSELNAQLLARAHFSGGLPLIAALRRMFAEAPSEIAALAVAADEPETVSALRFNQPLMWCRRGDASYLATSALAFPDDTEGCVTAVPACTTLRMSRDRLVIEPMPEYAEKLDPDAGTFRAAAVMEGMLASGGAFSIGEFNEALKNAAPKNGLAAQRALAVYSYLFEKLKRGEVERADFAVPASLPGTETALWRFRRATVPFAWKTAKAEN